MTRPKPDAEPLVRELKEVGELAGAPDRIDELIRRALDILDDAIPAQLVTFMEVAAGVATVRHAAGAWARPALAGRKIALTDFPVLHDVLQRGHAQLIADCPPDEHVFGDVLELPAGMSRMIVPVAAAGQVVGLLTFDRRRAGDFPQDTIRLAQVYGVLLALGVIAARRAEELESLREVLEERHRLLVEEVQAETDACAALESCVTKSMRRIVRMAKQVAVTDAPVLITGETGTGKEVLARAIHGWSPRASEPFVQLNCAALPENLIESELFGHKRGAFSGATADRPGRFRLADGGTLMLDEIAELPLALQAKLLRVVQEGTFEPVGGDRTVTVDARIIAATNAELEQAVAQGKFREDLYYRLHVFPIEVPPLRERIDDLPILVEHVLARIQRRTGRGPWTVRRPTLARMARYSWPGNVRELVNVLERARVLAPLGGPLRVVLDDDGPSAPRARAGTKTQWPSLAEHERRFIERALEHTRGKIYGRGGAAALLGLPPSTLQSRMKKLGVVRPPGTRSRKPKS